MQDYRGVRGSKPPLRKLKIRTLGGNGPHQRANVIRNEVLEGDIDTALFISPPARADRDAIERPTKRPASTPRFDVNAANVPHV